MVQAGPEFLPESSFWRSQHLASGVTVLKNFHLEGHTICKIKGRSDTDSRVFLFKFWIHPEVPSHSLA